MNAKQVSIILREIKCSQRYQTLQKSRKTETIPGDIGRYQIDYILVKERFRNQVKDCKSYPGADIDSDHNPVIIKCSLKFETTKKLTRTDKCNIGKLQNKETGELFQKAIKKELVSTEGSGIGCIKSDSINDR